MPSTGIYASGIALGAIGLGLKFGSPDILKGISSDVVLSSAQLQMAVTGFCMSPLPYVLNTEEFGSGTGVDVTGDHTFIDHGTIGDDDYEKSSIYSLLYALYATADSAVSEHGVEYEFTFNTWGFAPSPYPKEDPQRFGKAAYAGLVQFPIVQEYVKQREGNVSVVEIGCGTGAGANLITREILTKADYLAIDMQKAGIETCKRKHGNDENLGLNCKHAPGGVGNKGNKVTDMDDVKVPDNSVDFVIISETHIADVQIGPEEKEIFAEIQRILKPGGMFLWGNALPTTVWHDGFAHLESNGFTRAASVNHTKGAVIARDEDTPRVEAYCSHLYDMYHVFKLPFLGPKCMDAADKLLKNFYRHPGTALYLKMVTGFDSYMHEAYVKN